MANDIKKRKRKGDTERKIYELLGVKVFRYLVFKLEKFIHRKDGLKNVNYHVKRNDVDSFEEFKKYLYYNGYIHVKNGLTISGLIVVLLIISANPITISVAILDLIKNLYCVMLQRYNYIGINQYIETKENSIQRKIDKRTEEFKASEDYERINSLDLEKSSAQLEELKGFLEGREDILLDDSYKDTLMILQSYLNSIKKESIDINPDASSINLDEGATNNINESIIGNTLKRERKR